jgi:hypothetical protein
LTSKAISLPPQTFPAAWQFSDRPALNAFLYRRIPRAGASYLQFTQARGEQERHEPLQAHSTPLKYRFGRVHDDTRRSISLNIQSIRVNRYAVKRFRHYGNIHI